MEALDQLRDQILQAQSNSQTLTQSVATEMQQVIDRIAALEGQVIDAAAVQGLTSRMTAINQAMSDANAAIQGIIPDAPPQPLP